MSGRPGCVSGIGVVVATALLAVLLGVALLTGAGMFSPGALNSQAKAAPLGGVSSHAQLGRECGACHTPFWSSQTMADKCMACHADVKSQIQGKSGLHGKLVGGQSSPTCKGCHPEHHGAQGALTDIDEATFPHELLGYSLRSHEEKVGGGRFACIDCHPKGLSDFDQAVCVTCHAKADAAFMTKHLAAFGKDCLPCHDGSGRNGANFDHGKLPFKLIGKHKSLSCEKCHAKAQSLQDLQKTPQDCFACHAKDDKHKGTFGQECGQCHTAETWKNAKFDHKIFPVDHGSKELKATCKTCHPTDTKSYTCYGCHAHTPANVVGKHEGKSLAELSDCIKCHEGGKGGD
jgi:hypothetical protein